MLHLDGVEKTFARPARSGPRTPALDGVRLTVEQGEFISILGPSGCGKTTLLRCVAGFETPERGRIRVADRDVTGGGRSLVPASERGIGFVPQDGALFPHLTIAANVGFGLRRWSRAARRARVADALELVGLGPLALRRPHQLSGGQQQRVALARAIAPNPQIVLLDEPFSALDAHMRESLRVEVRQILTELHATAVLVTHDQDEALSLGDRVAAMRNGQVVQAAAPREMYLRPYDVELARFLGSANVIDGVLDDAGRQRRVTCAFGALPVDPASGSEHRLRAAKPCRVLIRPEQVRVADQSNSSGVEGRLREISFHGHDSLLTVDVPRLRTCVAARVLGDLGLRPGDPVHLTVDRCVCVYPLDTTADPAPTTRALAPAV